MKLRVVARAGVVTSCAAALAIATAVPAVAFTRGGGTPTNTSSGASPSPCKYYSSSRLVTAHTKKSLFQPYEQYTGTVRSPSYSNTQDAQPLTVVIDRCHGTSKVAALVGTIPAYSCDYGGQYALGAFGIFRGQGRTEPPISAGSFSFHDAKAMFPFTASGTVTGTVKIPKRGPGKGTSEITGTLTPDLNPTSCPVEHAPFTVKFKRTWSYLTASGLS